MSCDDNVVSLTEAHIAEFEEENQAAELVEGVNETTIATVLEVNIKNDVKNDVKDDDHNDENEDEDEGESADIFGNMGSEIMPWKRLSSVNSSHVSLPSATAPSIRKPSLQRKTYELQNDTYREISDMTKRVYDSFDKRELMLKTSYTNTRFFMIENFSETELLKYEMLLKDLRDKSILKDAEDIDIKLESIDPLVSVDDLREKKISDIRNTWLIKILKASEDHVNKSNLVRSMFRRTHEFFNDLNDMEYQYLTKKHLREIAKQDVLHKLRIQDDQHPHVTERLNSMEISQQKELQWVQFKNIKEVYVRMVQKEWSAMDNHLSMLEELYQALHKIYIDVMNLKIRSVNEWYEFRIRKDQSLRDAIHTLQDACYTDFHAYKDIERRVELKDVKASAEEDRKVRYKSFTEAETVISSELVFGMTMKRQKALYILDDAASSEATFDMDTDEMSTDGKNAEFLAYVRKRMRKKGEIEGKYNSLLKNTTAKYELEEKLHLETNRKREREHMKVAMEKYFELEKTLSDKIQVFLALEKKAIEDLKATHASELDGIVLAHDLDFDKLIKHENKVQRKLSKAENQSKESNSNRDHQADTMITAHVFHEVRNVLASILCLGENIKENPLKLEEIVNEQCDICNYALETMNDMLDVAKIKTSSYAVKQDIVNVSDLFDEVIRLQGQRAKKGVEVVKHVADATLQIVTEKRLLRQLLVNLLSNAAKFTSQGQITLFAWPVTKSKTECIKLGIADTGSGISTGITAKINNSSIADGNVVQGFIETQSDLSNSTIDKVDMNEYTARSSGYGLYLASTVAKTLGGCLKVMSPVENACSINANGSGSEIIFPTIQNCPGSFFYTILPCKIAGERDHVRKAPVVNNGWCFHPCGKMTVLIVDDQKLLRHAMIGIFRKLCEQFQLTVDICTASSAEEGLRKQRMKHYDFITLDQHYDQSVIARNVLAKKSAAPIQPLHLSTSTVTNKAACIQFKNDETFQTIPGDGVLLGTEVVGELSKGSSSPVILCCTGSADVEHPFVLTKPYTIERFISLMELHMNDFLHEKIVVLDGELMRKSQKLTLYKLKK